MSDAGLRAAWAAEGLRTPLCWLAETGSTNADARVLAEAGAAHGTAVAADAQTAGRGRLGRTWVAPPGANLTLSVVLRPSMLVSSLPSLVMAAGVAVVEACGAPCKLKWPNDVLAPDGRKVAGLLADAELGGGDVVFVVMGIGVNVAIAPEGVPSACLHEVVGAIGRDALAARVVAGLLRWTSVAERDPIAVLDAWRAWDTTLGREVRVGDVHGVAVDIATDGSLIVEEAGGARRRVLAGDVEMVGSGCPVIPRTPR